MSIGEMLCTNLCDNVMAEPAHSMYGHANGRFQKDELHENNLKASF